MGDDRILPRVKTSGLVIKELADETLIYDVDTNTAFCLNAPAAVIMGACDGRSTVADAQRFLAEKAGSAVDDDLIWNTVEEFRRRNLLADGHTVPFSEKHVSRRTLLKQAAALRVALPIVMVLAAPPALHAASACIAVGQSCQQGSGLPCCAGLTCFLTEGTFGTCQPTAPISVPVDPNSPPTITIDGSR
ncbi:MAG: hypothetical protein ACJ73D_12850 [Pyrinomonadaceae bacterium]